MKKIQILLLTACTTMLTFAQGVAERVVRDESGARIEVAVTLGKTDLPRGVRSVQVIIQTIYNEGGELRRTFYMDPEVPTTGNTVVRATVPDNLQGYFVRVESASGGQATTRTRAGMQFSPVQTGNIKTIIRQADGIEEGWHEQIMTYPMGHFKSEKYLTAHERMQRDREARR